MSHTTTAHTVVDTRVARPGLWAYVRHLQKALMVRRERRALLALDDRMLADVGLSQADAYREAHRPFLDVSAAARRTNTW